VYINRLNKYETICHSPKSTRWGRGVLDTTLCDEVCQWLATGRWFSPGPTVSSTNKTDHHDITEILLKVALMTTKQTIKVNFYKMFFLMVFVMFPFIFYAVRLFQNSKTARPKVETPTFLYISVVFWSLKIALEEVKLVKYTSYLLCFQVQMYIYVWKLNQAVLELDFWAVKFFVLPSTGFELTPLIHCSTIRLALRPAP
jgi:hypothetical protein